MPGQFFFFSPKLIPCKEKMWIELANSMDLENATRVLKEGWREPRSPMTHTWLFFCKLYPNISTVFSAPKVQCSLRSSFKTPHISPVSLFLP